MAITYAQLLQSTQDYCENTETSFVSNIPIFVAQAETRIFNSVHLPLMRKVSTATAMVASTNTIAAPTDFLAMFEFSLTDSAGAQFFLLNKDVSYIRESFPLTTAIGQPTHYALQVVAAGTPFATTLLLGPTPDANYATTMDYYAYPTSIVTGGTSWLGNNFDTVLLYGTLREAYVYMKGEADVVAEYEAKYQEALLLLKNLADGLDRRDAYRSGQLRLPVA